MQDEIDFLRVQLVQFEDKHKQQLMSQDKRYEDEILKYKRLLDSANAKLLLVLIINFFFAFIYFINLSKFSVIYMTKKEKKKKEIHRYNRYQLIIIYLIKLQIKISMLYLEK